MPEDRAEYDRGAAQEEKRVYHPQLRYCDMRFTSKRQNAALVLSRRTGSLIPNCLRDEMAFRGLIHIPEASVVERLLDLQIERHRVLDLLTPGLGRELLVELLEKILVARSKPNASGRPLVLTHTQSVPLQHQKPTEVAS